MLHFGFSLSVSQKIIKTDKKQSLGIYESMCDYSVRVPLSELTCKKCCTFAQYANVYFIFYLYLLFNDENIVDFCCFRSKFSTNINISLKTMTEYLRRKDVALVMGKTDSDQTHLSSSVCDLLLSGWMRKAGDGL